MPMIMPEIIVRNYIDKVQNLRINNQHAVLKHLLIVRFGVCYNTVNK